ncbi:hypothetical protein BDD12DRAFT_916161 [Trichophaea hybrida]|nr:hypothetical protein BDD12DRAFT_916161 [Trichophaea hybrida]
MATEAVRVLSYTLPCPLPDAPGPEVPSSSTNPVRPDRLPVSASSAPAVASAAGQQLSPAVLARCTSKDDSVSLPFRGADLGTTTALHHMTAAIQRRCLNEGTRRVYIHVSHAIDPQIPLTRLPSTPPVSSTVSSPSRLSSEGGESGYFSPTVFNSIVVAPNSLASTPIAGTPMSSLPPSFPFSSPILPPNSLHLTLLERYIPPASLMEDAAMFSTRSSILIDRLFELSPQGGSALFIYPTKTGAMSFDRDYLGPVLDPLLRKLMVLYRLREDLLWNIRNMAATPHLAEFPELQARVERLCKALTDGEGEMPTKLVYSTKATVSLNELSWREWWTQQEQTRIREIVKKHMANQPGSESTGYGVPGDLAREVLDGVRAPNVRPSSRGMGEAVLASSMSGSGGGSGAVSSTAGMGRIAGGTKRLESLKKRGVEVGIFILRRGLEY